VIEECRELTTSSSSITRDTRNHAFGPVLLPFTYTAVVVLAAALWTAAFVLFLKVDVPILLSPRADGKSG